MGRKLRRVPMGFDWPLDKVWWGFTLASVPCGACKGGHVTYQTKYASKSVEGWECPFCWGEGEANPGDIEPPEGDGWQLWEEVSEGSPITPVFATAEELANWLVTPGNDKSITCGTTREQWLQMFHGPGWAPSMVYTPQTGVVPGTQMPPPKED